jgi:hypothetical protein
MYSPSEQFKGWPLLKADLIKYIHTHKAADIRTHLFHNRYKVVIQKITFFIFTFIHIRVAFYAPKPKASDPYALGVVKVLLNFAQRRKPVDIFKVSDKNNEGRISAPF